MAKGHSGLGATITAVIAFAMAVQAPSAVGQEANHPDMQHSMPEMVHAMMSSMETNDAGDMRPEMSGLYGPYSITRESSGTAWEPETTPIRGSI